MYESVEHNRLKADVLHNVPLHSSADRMVSFAAAHPGGSGVAFMEGLYMPAAFTFPVRLAIPPVLLFSGTPRYLRP